MIIYNPSCVIYGNCLALFSLLRGGRMEKEIVAFCGGGGSGFFHHVLPEVQDE